MTNLNEINKPSDRPEEYVERCEREYFEKVKMFADIIENGDHNHRIIALSGPSGSGKTTTAGMLKKLLSNRGIGTAMVSLDDFYLGRDKAPLLANGEPDYETVDALNLPLLRFCITELIRDGHTYLPKFDFRSGAPDAERVEMRLLEGDVVIVEGIHAMNPVFTDYLPPEKLTRLFVSIEEKVDTGNGILTGRDLRLVRRLTRDFIYRNSSPSNTLKMWETVIHGEEKYLYPFKHLAEYTINSFHSYEPCMFRALFLDHMDRVDETDKRYEKAQQMKLMMSGFEEIDPALVPEHSLMREFIGEAKA